MRRVLFVAVLLAVAAAPAPAAGQLTELLSQGVDAVRRQAGRAQQAGADAAVVTRTVNVRDVDLATLKQRLARFGVEIPIEAEGRVNATLTVTARLAELTRPGAVTATGRLSSARLTLAPLAAPAAAGNPGAAADPLVLTDLKANLSLARGALSLDDLTVGLPLKTPSGQTPSGKTQTGTLTGSASLPLAGEEDVATATLTAKGVPLDLLWSRLSGLPITGGTFDGSVTASVPWTQRDDPAAYDASARVSATGLTVAGRAVDDLNARLTLTAGTTELNRLTALVAGQPLSGTASVGLVAPHPYAAAVTSDRLDLSALSALFPPAQFPDGPPAWLPTDLAGTLALDVQSQGTLVPATGTLTASLRGGAPDRGAGRGAARSRCGSTGWR